MKKVKILGTKDEQQKLDTHNFKKKVASNINKHYPFIFTILGIFFYISSLEKCELDNEGECYKLFFPRVKELVYKIIFSGFLFSITYIIPLLKKDSNSLMVFILSFITQFLLYLKDDGTNFKSHGGYNRILFICITIIFTFLNISLYIIYQIYKKIQKFYSIVFTLLIMFYLFFSIGPIISNSCGEWNIGLNSTKINNSIGCKFSQPKICWLKIFDGFFDISKISGINKCNNNNNNDDKNSTEFFYKNAKILAFPETQRFTFEERAYKNIQKNILENMNDISSLPKSAMEEFEVILDRTDKENPFVKINVPKDQNLIDHKNELWRTLDPNKKPLTENVLLIFLDTVSRPQFKQRLPKVWNWINKFYNNKESKIEAFQFFKYNAPIANTNLSFGPVITGTHPNKRDVTNKLIYSNFKERGFITAHSINFCTGTPVSYEPDDTKFFYWENFDFEFFSIFCDPNFTTYGKEYSMFKGPYSIFRKCLYGKDTFEYLLDFGDLFWNNYSEQKKFMQLSFMDAHEITLETIKYLDQPLLDFLEKNEKNFIEKDTTLIFMSDHGLHMNGFGHALELDDIITELTVPSLFVLLPRKLADGKYGENLKKNENVMIGNYDIHNMLQDLSGKSYYSRWGDSLFNDMSKKKRECKVDLLIADKNCRCFNENEDK